MKKLFIDLEVIAANNGNVFDDAIASIEYKAGKRYLEHITELFMQRAIKEEEYRLFLEESHDYKDRILEEVDDEYKNLIDFTKIYEINDSNESIVDYINKISNSIDTYIIFYYNTSREKEEKENVCKKYFQNCKTMGIKYYTQDYKKGLRRERTNKAEYVVKKLGLNNLSDSMLIDKSRLCCDEWSNLNGYSSLYCGTQGEDNNHKLGKQRG